ncbi:MAG TPA: ATP-dependent DNA helicase RecG, partial [Pseudonocardia sp.]|nr:ATP-dependent DNA helicase RecG [Pseudonocardia sp.]
MGFDLDMDSPLSTILGAAAARELATHLDLQTVGELVRHYPRRYLERGELSDIAGLQLGEYATLVARVESTTMRQMRQRHGQMLAVVLRDDRGGRLDATFFNPYKLRSVLKPGVRALFAGQVGAFRGKLQLTHPQFEPLPPGDEVRPFLSIYPATAKLPSWKIGNCVRQVLDVLDDPTDPLPAELRKAERLTELGQALRRIHVPETAADHQAARHRLVWDEAMGVQVALALRRRATVSRPAPACPPKPGGLLTAFDAQLPFTLTAGQVAVGEQIATDLAAAHPMNRLVQGDVGAGKTVIALRAMLQVIDAGRQTALLAPTEVLAAQHARSLRTMLGPLGLAGQLGSSDQATSVTLLTGSLGTKARRQALLDAQSGAAGIVVGTHALIQDHVGFADLGLVVVDEQHRFGVEQRDALRGRGELAPHMLVMTATPIPRTVAMTVYGDLAISSLRELPAGRSPISTTVVPLAEKPAWVERVWARVREEVAAGRQAYVVCPRIGDDGGPEDEPEDVDGAPSTGDERRPPLAVL